MDFACGRARPALGFMVLLAKQGHPCGRELRLDQSLSLDSILSLGCGYTRPRPRPPGWAMRGARPSSSRPCQEACAAWCSMWASSVPRSVPVPRFDLSLCCGFSSSSVLVLADGRRGEALVGFCVRARPCSPRLHGSPCNGGSSVRAGAASRSVPVPRFDFVPRSWLSLCIAPRLCAQCCVPSRGVGYLGFASLVGRPSSFCAAFVFSFTWGRSC